MSPSGKTHKLGLPEKMYRGLRVLAEETERRAQEAVHTDSPFLAWGSLRLWCAWGWAEREGSGGGMGAEQPAVQVGWSESCRGGLQR